MIQASLSRGARNFSSRGLVFYLAIASAFLLSFALPILIFAKFTNVFSNFSLFEERSDRIFPSSVNVDGPFTFVRVANAVDLDAPQDKDFLLVSWFKVSALPEPGDKMVLLSRYDDKLHSRRGYALGLSNDGGVVRPIAYWRDSEGHGGWRNFSEVNLQPRTWFMLGLSFYQGRYLGLSFASIVDGKKTHPKVLGGFDLGEGTFAQSSSDLLLGAFGISDFRGKVGPVGVFNLKNLGEDLKTILERFVELPTKIPERFAPDNVILWCLDGKSDLGKFGHKVEIIRQNKKASE